MPRTNASLPAIIGDCIKAVVNITGTDRVAQLTIPFMGTVFSGAGLASDVAAFPAALKASIEATLKACLPLTATITLYQAQAVSRNDVRNASLVSNVAGTVALSTSLPSNAGAVITRGVAVKGQHGRGRLTMPYVPNTFVTPAVDPNILNAGAITAYNAFIGALFGVSAPAGIIVNGHTYYPALHQRPVPPAQVVSMGAVIVVSFCTLETTLGTIKNRLRRRR
jgi:hypothetical protein